MRIRGAVAVIVVTAAGLIGIGATSHQDRPKVAVPAVAKRGPIVGVLPMIDMDEQFVIEQERGFYAEVRRQVDEYLASRYDQDVAAWAAAHTPPPPSPKPANAGYTNPGPSMGSCAGSVECFLACTIQHESISSGVYNAVSPGGTYRGAYQFDQQTWNNAVAHAGYPEYVGVPPNLAPPEVQDDAATWLYSVAGNRPWGGRC